MSGNGEYISRDALKELFDGIYDCSDLVFEPDDQICAKQHSSCGSCRWLETKRAIQKRVMSIPAADVRPRWIPVTERLPKADEHDARGYAVPYLVMNGWMRVTARRTKDYWVLFGNGTVLEYVTHWQPLPEPPEEEQ